MLRFKLLLILAVLGLVSVNLTVANVNASDPTIPSLPAVLEGVVAFTTTASSVNESGATHNVEVTLTVTGEGTPLPAPITVNLLTSGTALSGTDYTALAATITFAQEGGYPAGTYTQNIALAITEDTEDEAAETVILTLDTPVGATLGTQTTHTATIEDNDEPAPTASGVVAFTTANSSVAENTAVHDVNVTLTVTGTGNLASPVTVNVTPSGTATSGADYTTPAAIVTFTQDGGFPAGTYTQNIALTITDDTEDEPAKTVILTLDSPVGATLGTQTTHTTTIEDNDDAPVEISGVVAFTAANSSVAENTAAHNVEVTLTVTGTGNLASPVTVNVTPSGTATSGTDYAAPVATVTFTQDGGFPAGTYTQNIALAITDDTEDEVAETVILTLAAPIGATLGTQASHTVTIEDNDEGSTDGGFLTFTAASSSVSESVPTHNVEVTLTVTGAATVPSPVTATLTTSGTATSGTDYTAPAVTITFTQNGGFPVGTYTQNIALSITDDTTLEGSETLILTLTNPTGAALGTTSAHTVTITDDEPIPTELTLIAPTGTITTPYGNPTYLWSDIGATTYELAVWRPTYGATDLIFYLTALNADTYCDGGLCSIYPTTQPTANESARLLNGIYDGWVRASDGQWVGPIQFTLNAPAPAPVTMAPTTGTDTLRPTAHWTLDATSDSATWFRLYLIRKDWFDAGYYVPVADFWVSRVQVCGSATSTTCSLQAGGDLEDNTNYYLAIQSYGPGGFSVGGDYSNGVARTEFRVDTVADPAVPSNVMVVPNQGHPTITWDSDPNATQFYVYIRTQTTLLTAYLMWHQAADVCTGATCTLTPEIALANGTYEVFVYACGLGGCSTGGTWNNGWGGTAPNNTFTLDFAAPPLVEELIASGTGGTITASWTAPAGTTWYQVWVGTENGAQTYYFQWHSAPSLNCAAPDSTCNISLPLGLTTGTYYIAIQSAGPGGWLTTGGLIGNGYQVSAPINMP